MHRADRRGGLCRAGRRGQGFPRRQIQRGAGQDRAADGQGRRSARFRERGDPARPAARRDLHPGQPGGQRRGRGRCRCLRAGGQGRADRGPGLLYPRRAELGPQGVLPQEHRRDRQGRRPRRRAAAILRGSASAAHHPHRSHPARAGADRRGAGGQGRAPGGDLDPAARRQAAADGTGQPQRHRSARPAAGRDRDQGDAQPRAGRIPRAGRAAPADRTV